MSLASPKQVVKALRGNSRDHSQFIISVNTDTDINDAIFNEAVRWKWTQDCHSFEQLLTQCDSRLFSQYLHADHCLHHMFTYNIRSSLVSKRSSGWISYDNYIHITQQDARYGDGAGNTVEENSRIFSLIWMHWLPSVLWHRWLGGRKGIRPVKNGGLEVGTG